MNQLEKRAKTTRYKQYGYQEHVGSRRTSSLGFYYSSSLGNRRGTDFRRSAQDDE